MFFENKFVGGLGRRKEKETCLACGGGGVCGGVGCLEAGEGCVCVVCVAGGRGYPYRPADKKQQILGSLLHCYFSTKPQCWGIWLLVETRAHLSDFSLQCVPVELVHQISERMRIARVRWLQGQEFASWHCKSSLWLITASSWVKIFETHYPTEKQLKNQFANWNVNSGVGRKLQSMSIHVFQRNSVFTPAVWFQCEF